MRLIEELNNIINEAMWDYDSQEYKDMMKENHDLTDSFSNHCQQLDFTLEDRHRLKDGTGRTVYLKYSKASETNYAHILEYRLQISKIVYKIIKEGNTNIHEFENIKSIEDIDKAFSEINKIYEEVE